MRYLIEDYINKITLSDILLFAKKNDIYLTNKEANILLNYIKNNWKLVYKNPEIITNEINKNFDKNKSKKIINLFNKYKNYL